MINILSKSDIWLNSIYFNGNFSFPYCSFMRAKIGYLSILLYSALKNLSSCLPPFSSAVPTSLQADAKKSSQLKVCLLFKAQPKHTRHMSTIPNSHCLKNWVKSKPKAPQPQPQAALRSQFTLFL